MKNMTCSACDQYVEDCSCCLGCGCHDGHDPSCEASLETEFFEPSPAPVSVRASGFVFRTPALAWRAR